MMRSPSEPITYMEEDLIQRSRAGDSDAFAALVEEHRDAMYHLAWRMVGSPEDAADLVQEAFVRAYRSLDRFEGRSSFRTWVHRITVHCCLNHLRRRKRKGEVAYQEEWMDNPGYQERAGEARLHGRIDRPDQAADRSDLTAAIEGALGELSPDHRAAFLLREYNGLSYKEIAEATGVSMGTVMSRLHYARKALQEILTERIPGHTRGRERGVESQ